MSDHDKLQEIIIRNILTNDIFMRQVLPFIQPEYFEGLYSDTFKGLAKYVAKYNKLPTEESFTVYAEDSNLYGNRLEGAQKLLPAFFKEKSVDNNWLLDVTEKWCRDRALYNAIMQSIEIINDDGEEKSKDGIPDILSKALAVCFDDNIGHDYLDNWSERYEFYHEDLERIPFELDMFNEITNGGLVRKTLNIIMAGTGVGKSLAMCSLSASNLAAGRNVLYITAEMAEERIAERIDANLLDVPIDQLVHLSKDMFKDRVSSIASKTQGKLIIKEYPTSQAHTGHLRALLNELKLKKEFVPDVIYVDYLNILASSRVKSGASGGTYSLVKSIAEELRGLAVEFDVPIVSATQTTREGFDSSDPNLTDTSESFGLPATADLFLVMVSTEEMETLGQVMFKQLKNRYADVNKNRRFVVNIERPKMRLTDASPDQQNLVTPGGNATNGDDGDSPVFDNSNFGKRMECDVSQWNV